MVVLIVGISLVAYVAYRLLGAHVGAVLGGIFGGLISSTATTVSYARQTKENNQASPLAALVIIIASTVVNVRVCYLKSEWWRRISSRMPSCQFS